MVPPLISALNADSVPASLLSPFLLPSPVVDLPGTARALLVRDEPSCGSGHKFDPSSTQDIVFACLIPALVMLSGLFAGLTLGYMSLDETQLKVLSISGTPEQREYAKKIQPVRQNGHLLLVTLLLGNMIVNETLPVISDHVLGGGIQGVVVSTVLIVIFAEVIPQSLFTRHGLYLGAKMATFTRCLIILLGIIAWPVAKLLEFVLGPHHGIIYRRAELKELIALHSDHATHGGDLKTDTVTIIGATLDLQEKVVNQAMTPIEDVFMLDIEAKLDYDLLKKICQTGHSRVPVYEEVDVPVTDFAGTNARASNKERTRRVKKILGILLVKQCVLLDPKDATPLRKIPLNKVPFVPKNEPLLGILDKFQEGRSHMAIVSRFNAEKAESVKQAVKRGLTQRLRGIIGDSDSSDEDRTDDRSSKARDAEEITLKEDGISEQDKDKDDFADVVLSLGRKKKRGIKRFQLPGSSSSAQDQDVEMGNNDSPTTEEGRKRHSGLRFQLPKAAASLASVSLLEQSMPADAVLAKEGADEFLQSYDPAVMPLGIITLEDVLEELIGEEIYDEFDPQGAHGDPYHVPPPQTHGHDSVKIHEPVSDVVSSIVVESSIAPLQAPPASLRNLGFLRTRSAPPIPREFEGTSASTPVGENVKQSTDTADSSDVDRRPIDVTSTHTVGGAGRNATGTSSTAPTTPTYMTTTFRGSAAPVHPLGIEAVLLGRTRKPLTPPSGASGSGLKGSRFKSSPLWDVERAGMVVAETVKEDLGEKKDRESEKADGEKMGE